jgi:phosphoribosyl-AMP cyclohydrolase
VGPPKAAPSVASKARAIDRSQLEEGQLFLPRFDADGLIVCVTIDAVTGAVLMVAYMNAAALDETLATGIVHYWSRSRQQLWRKGDTSGQFQTIVEVRADCDQDALLLKVHRGGDGMVCHTGRLSCFYRRLVQRGSAWILQTDGTDSSS